MKSLIIDYISRNFSIGKKTVKLNDKDLYTEDFLRGLNFSGNLSEKEFNMFEFLIKKIEVTKKLHKHYDMNTLKPVTVAHVPANVCAVFMCYCMLFYLSTQDYKFLNTFLKIKDGVLFNQNFGMNLELRIMCEEFVLHVL